MSRSALPKCCPNCGASRSDAYGLRISQFGRHKQWCTGCGWNNAIETRSITRDDYQYWFRLTRIGFDGWQLCAHKPKQPLDILKPIIHELCAREVPYWMRLHLERATFPFLGAPRWYFEPFCQSRWEYHTMLEEGVIKTPQEYQAFYIERREYQVNNPPEYEEYEVAE